MAVVGGISYLLANKLLLGERLREDTKGNGETIHDEWKGSLRVTDVDSYVQCKRVME